MSFRRPEPIRPPAPVSFGVEDALPDELAEGARDRPLVDLGSDPSVDVASAGVRVSLQVLQQERPKPVRLAESASPARPLALNAGQDAGKGLLQQGGTRLCRPAFPRAVLVEIGSRLSARIGEGLAFALGGLRREAFPRRRRTERYAPDRVSLPLVLAPGKEFRVSVVRGVVDRHGKCRRLA